jgi:hypothetical protein
MDHCVRGAGDREPGSNPTEVNASNESVDDDARDEGNK